MIQLSVIIPTRNRCKLLKGTLESIVHQSFQQERFEVIVVDNGSVDQTNETVQSFRGRIKNLRYHYDATEGLHVGRHEGYKLAIGDILVYADDDIEAFPTWLEGIYESFENPEVMLVGGKNYPKYEEKPPFWIEEKWYELCSEGHCLPALSLIDFGDEIKQIPPCYVFGCNFSVRKHIIFEAGGFHPDGFPFDKIQYRGDGESYIDKYIAEHGYKAIYNPKASVFHLVTAERLTLDYFKRRAFRAGVEMSYTDKRYQSNMENKNKQNKVKYFIYKILDKFRMLMQLPEKCQMTEIDKQIERSRQIGYSYHDYLYKKNPELRKWVHKNTYL